MSQIGKAVVKGFLKLVGATYAITLLPNSGQTADYSITAPTGLPSSTKALTIDSSGNINYAVYGTGNINSVSLTFPSIFTATDTSTSTAIQTSYALTSQAANLFFAGPSTGSPAAPTFRALAYNDVSALIGTGTNTLAAGNDSRFGKQYRGTFTNASLTSGILTVTHNLNSQYNAIFIYDNNGKIIIPDDITASSANATAVDLSSFGTLTGTWNVVIVG